MNVHDVVRTKSRNINQSYPQYIGVDSASRDTRDQKGIQRSSEHSQNWKALIGSRLAPLTVAGYDLNYQGYHDLS